MVELTDREIDVAAVIRSVQDQFAGGIDVFIGTTRCRSNDREVVALEYQAYPPMAVRVINQLVDAACRKWSVRKISVMHRTGRLNVGEASIVIAVSAAHRREAFEACRFMIDSIKESVPIWKKEFSRDGEVWIGREGHDLRPS
jgi:molybdopterin synthase catalytic subunit